MKNITILIILVILAGCKPKQVVTEKVAGTSDSTSTLAIQAELSERESKVDSISAYLEALREIKSQLLEEVSRHEIKYDTSALVNPETWKYPIAEEVKTESRVAYENKINEQMEQTVVLIRDLSRTSTENIFLEQEVSRLKSENRELMKKVTPTAGFNLRLFLAGAIAGIILAIAIRYSIKKIII